MSDKRKRNKGIQLRTVGIMPCASLKVKMSPSIAVILQGSLLTHGRLVDDAYKPVNRLYERVKRHPRIAHAEVPRHRAVAAQSGSQH